MFSNTLLGVSVLLSGIVSLTTASATDYPSGSRPCVQLRVPVTVSANNTAGIDFLSVTNASDASELALAIDASDSTIGQLNQTAVVQGTFNISAQLCVPQGSKANILQIATHGITFEKRYWDSEYNPDVYSYVDATLASGYSILTYDRLGVGQSSKPDGLNVVQLTIQIEILKALTDLARAGTLISSSTIVGGGAGSVSSSYKPDKVVHVGHSYGSFLSLALVAKYPTAATSDGVVLTGFLSSNPPFLPKMGFFSLTPAHLQDPSHFADVPDRNYIALGSQVSYLYGFLSKLTLDVDAFNYYWGIRQTTTPGELMSLFVQVAAATQAVDFSGPILVFTGQRDRAFCAGTTCDASVNVTYLETLWPKASRVDVYLQPDTGHVLTSSVNATAGYKALLSWVDTWIH